MKGDALMSRVAVTGCSSRFAQVFLPLLEADKEVTEIVGIDLVPLADTYSKLVFHRLDIRDASVKEIMAGCDALVHLAFVVGRPYSMPLYEAASINLGGTWNVCRLAAEAGIPKLVVSSSVAAYGGLSDNPAVLVEDSPLRGLYTDFYYNQHKHANEIWLDGLQLAFPRLLISRLRPCIVMGPHQSAAISMIHPNKSYFTSPEAHQSQLQFVHEDDLAAAFQAMVQHDLPGAYNVVGDGPDSMPRIAAAAGLNVIEIPLEMIAQSVTSSWQKGETVFGPEWLGGEGDIICSNEKLKATGVWMPRYTTTEAYEATVEALA
jgi:UDP-glucose 4-epimerase